MSNRSSAPAPASKRGGKKLLLACVGLLVLVGGAAVAYPRLSAAEGEEAERPVATKPGVLELEPMVLNLASPGGDRYVRLSPRLVLDQDAVAQRAGEGLPKAKLRDRMLTLLSCADPNDLATVEGKEALREEIRVAVQPLFHEPPFHDSATDPAPARVLDVLFAEFLLQ